MLRLTSKTWCVEAQPEAVTSSRCVEVRSPGNLHEGYVFWATFENTSFPVKVPPGGVRLGQTLRVPLLDTSCQQPPTGAWKDGIFSCFRFGLCHPHLCNAWLCPQLLLAQMLQRMNLSWLANPTTPKSSIPSAARNLLLVFLFFCIYDRFGMPPPIEFAVDDQGNIRVEQHANQWWYHLAYLCLSLPPSIYGLLVVIRLRAAIRTKYGITTGVLGRMEDFCCVLCCNCCVLSQMARQIANYDSEPAACCSATGVTSHCTDEDELLEDAYIPVAIAV